MQEASGHLDSSGVEVNLQVVFVEPCEAKDHTLLSESGDYQQNLFGMSAVGHENINDFVNASGFIGCSIYIIDWDGFGELADWKLGSGDKISIDEVPSRTSINHGFCGGFFHSVHHLQMNQEHDTAQTLFKRVDHESLAHLFLQLGSAGPTGL